MERLTIDDWKRAQIFYVNELIDTIDAQARTIEILAQQVRELEERVAKLEANPPAGVWYPCPIIVPPMPAPSPWGPSGTGGDPSYVSVTSTSGTFADIGAVSTDEQAGQ